jgi:NDP-sugar pyrophosphorylase family protein
VDDPSEYGIVLMNEDSRITRFLEKPKGEVIFSNTANTGVYVFEPEIFDLIRAGRFISSASRSSDAARTATAALRTT